MYIDEYIQGRIQDLWLIDNLIQQWKPILREKRRVA
jgi:hypothetical protein